ncbi:MAG: histidinol-phosphate transaminase [Firmicutes bacterium]|nr:histidinol-phosphate transaminase [Bacillota bacterium]
MDPQPIMPAASPEFPAGCDAVRGAITVAEDSRAAIRKATLRLLQEMVRRNGLRAESIVAALFSATADLTAEAPAAAARQLGWTHVPLMCFQEMAVAGSLPRCIRVLLFVRSRWLHSALRPVYLDGAAILRPDLAVGDGPGLSSGNPWTEKEADPFMPEEEQLPAGAVEAPAKGALSPHPAAASPHLRLPFLPARPEVERLKPYIPGKPIEDVREELGLQDVVKLASNENPWGPPPAAVRALQAQAARVHLYPDGQARHLRQALAQHLGVGMESIFVGNGSDEILKLLAEAFIRPGDRAVVAQPTFSEYEYAVTLLGGRVVEVPVDAAWRLDLPAMAEAVRAGARVVFLCNPNNPTGTMVTRSELLQFLRQIPPEVLVVCDEAYHEYATDPEYPDTVALLGEYPGLVILRTFSKIYGLAGLRVGYAIAHPDLVAVLQRVREPFNVNALAQAAAVAALGDKDFVEESRRQNSAERDFLRQSLEAMGYKVLPSQANFLFFDSGVDSRRLFQALLRRGVIVRSGDIFGCPTFVRVTVGTPAQNRGFLAALREVQAEL